MQKKLNTISAHQKVAAKGKVASKAVNVKDQAKGAKKVIALNKRIPPKVGKAAVVKPGLLKGKLAALKPVTKPRPALAQLKTTGK